MTRGTDGTGDEVFVSVDIEASGPTPSTGSLVAIGACVVDDEAEAFYEELRPIPGLPWSDRAERVHALSRQHLATAGGEPAEVMTRFEEWTRAVAGGRRPVLVAFNAPFDWMFLADYFQRFLGRNPFGVSALDIKTYYMARDGVLRWADTTKDAIRQRHPMPELSHNALDDARVQAALFRRLLQGRAR